MADGRQELTELELEGVGGAGSSLGDLRRYISNSKGERVGIVAGDQIYHYPCPQCGKPMHSGWFGYYCDPCNKRFDKPARVLWTGSEEELKSASL